METPEYFAPVPLQWNPTTKQVSSEASNPSQELKDALASINATHKSLQQLDPPSLLAPPPPQQPYINPKRSQQVHKLRESAQAALKKQSKDAAVDAESTAAPQSDAIKLYSLALEMALGRPAWEPQQLLREELASIYTSRASAYASIRAYADAYTDCRNSLAAKQQGNPGAYRLGSDALKEMGRTQEALQLVRAGVAQEENTLVQLRQQISQIPQGHPNLQNAKQSMQTFEKELETLRDMSRKMEAS